MDVSILVCGVVDLCDLLARWHGSHGDGGGRGPRGGVAHKDWDTKQCLEEEGVHGGVIYFNT